MYDTSSIMFFCAHVCTLCAALTVLPVMEAFVLQLKMEKFFNLPELDNNKWTYMKTKGLLHSLSLCRYPNETLANVLHYGRYFLSYSAFIPLPSSQSSLLFHALSKFIFLHHIWFILGFILQKSSSVTNLNKYCHSLQLDLFLLNCS